MQVAARNGNNTNTSNTPNPTITTLLETKVLTLSATPIPNSNPLVKSLSHHAISDSTIGPSRLKREASMQSM
ncbi:hypothetical protein EON63_16735 [archaeon]|nr:MAG: hypothetical protein EON63_16735 [archaeon]